MLQATLDTPSGTSAYDYLHGRWPIVEVVRFAIFQCQVVAADAIMVLPPTSSLPRYRRSLTTHQQIYRMFHIYDRKPFVCIIPSITTAALFCEFFPLYAPPPVCLPSSLKRGFLATACGLANQLRNPGGLKARDSWSWASFCLTILQVPMDSINLSGKMLTQKFLTQ